MRYIYYLLFVFLLYIYLHSPMFSFAGGIGSIKYLYPLVLIFFLSKRRSIDKLYSRYKGIIFVYFAIFLYLMFVYAMGSDTLFLYNTVVAFIQTLIFSYFFVSYRSPPVSASGYNASVILLP